MSVAIAHECISALPPILVFMNKKYGKIAYEAYCKARNWKSFNGDPLPQFEAQSPELQEAWILAAAAVQHEIKNESSPG